MLNKEIKYIISFQVKIVDHALWQSKAEQGTRVGLRHSGFKDPDPSHRVRVVPFQSGEHAGGSEVLCAVNISRMRRMGGGVVRRSLARLKTKCGFHRIDNTVKGPPAC